MLHARYWTLTYGVNRLYAEENGYTIEYVVPENATHYPNRKVGWAKVKVLLDRLIEEGCAESHELDVWYVLKYYCREKIHWDFFSEKAERC